MLDAIYKTVLMEHAKHKMNHFELKGPGSQQLYYKNPTCGDVMSLFWIVSEDDRLESVSFIGEGCSISMASVSIMTQQIKGKKIDQIAQQRQAMEQMIRIGTWDKKIDIGDAASLEGVHQLRARHNCALMGWQALDKALDSHEKYQWTIKKKNSIFK